MELQRILVTLDLLDTLAIAVGQVGQDTPELMVLLATLVLVHLDTQVFLVVQATQVFQATQV